MTLSRSRSQLIQRSAALALAAVVQMSCPAFSKAHEGHDHPHEGAHADHHSAASVMTTRKDALVLPPMASDDDEVFHFVIYGDRTGGVPEGLRVLEQAVVDTNLLDPDLVMTVGDLVQGYNTAEDWMPQMQEFKGIMNDLNAKWFPVAGNHDVYWRGQGPAPQGQNEELYEQNFGPLWYSFRHKNAGFIVLFSDEGNPETNQKAFNSGDLQNMSDEQLAFLDKALKELQDAEHVFVFLHHPRWIGGGYEGSNWPTVHNKLAAAGNVSAVFAGHIHHMRYDGKQDGIEYFALATTGGHLSADIPDAGYLHHLNMVTVRNDRISVSAIPVGAVFDPKKFTSEFLAEVSAARTIRPQQTSPELIVNADGTCTGEVVMKIKNPGQHDVDITLVEDTISTRQGWHSTLDHQHFQIAKGEEKEITFAVSRGAGGFASVAIPSIKMEIDLLSSDARVRLPDVTAPLQIAPGQVPADYFSGNTDRCLLVANESSAIRINSDDLHLPDGPMTLEAWVRPTDVAGYTGVLAKTQGSEFAIFSDEGVPQFTIHLNGGYVSAKATHPMVVDQWSHIAGCFDGGSVKLFVDGKLVDSETVNKKNGQGTAKKVKQKRNELPFYIGADPDPSGRPTRAVRAMIDEVRISKSAVYADDFTPVTRHTPEPDTVLLMHLDRATGPFVLDHSNSASYGLMGSTSKLVESPPKAQPAQK
ncbi:LamG-like jellyroll fold domain-containing protein [Allorhodopirellula heiligendammensis]|nr:LamG-like jellyroll fold domain-containing protein [Allorhodopirellula heiligendammensis]